MDLISTQRLASVHPKLVQAVETVYDYMASQGMPILVVSGYRSVDQQDKLYASGRTLAGKIVTNARGGQSMHNYGLAVDVQPLLPHGVLDEHVEDPAWKAMIAAMKAQGLAWGGDWLHFKDFPHFQLPHFPNPTPQMNASIHAEPLQSFWSAFDEAKFG